MLHYVMFITLISYYIILHYITLYYIILHYIILYYDIYKAPPHPPTPKDSISVKDLAGDAEGPNCKVRRSIHHLQCGRRQKIRNIHKPKAREINI